MANDGKALKILAIRFSAIGDVAMTVPVVDSFLRQYPQHHITFLSNPRFEAFFSGMPGNFTFLGADVKKEYHGNAGLRRLIRELAAMDFDLVLDLHGVLRSERIGLGLLTRGVRVKRIRKDRLGRKAVTRRHFKSHKPLKTSFERYCNVFERAGLPVRTDFKSISAGKPQFAEFGEKQGRWVGIAPFAAHQGKIYPLSLMEKVIEMLESDDRCYVESRASAGPVDEGRRKLVGLCAATGVARPKDTSEFHGVPVRIIVRNRYDRNGSPRSEIREWKEARG